MGWAVHKEPSLLFTFQNLSCFKCSPMSTLPETAGMILWAWSRTPKTPPSPPKVQRLEDVEDGKGAVKCCCDHEHITAVDTFIRPACSCIAYTHSCGCEHTHTFLKEEGKVWEEEGGEQEYTWDKRC